MNMAMNSEIEFFFYLDAWNYCWRERLCYDCIKRKNWKVWSVVR